MKDFYILLLILFVYSAQPIISISHYDNSNSKKPDTEIEPNSGGFFQKIIQIYEPEYRLPTAIVPRNYTLKIRPILVQGENQNVSETGKPWTAPGSVKIVVDCKETTNNITLHSRVAEIINSSVKVTFTNGTSIAHSSLTFDTDKNFLIILFNSSNPLKANESYTISIDFVSQIFTSGKNFEFGMYRSRYPDSENQDKRYVVTTQFQASGARLAFPCFDEPGLKSTFEIIIGRSTAENYTAFSNNPLKSTVPNEEFSGWVWDIFEPTVPMSTYLVAWIISDYGAASAPSGIFDKPVQTLAPKDAIESGKGNYTAEIAARALAFYESYFDVKYPMGKMDSAAVGDFNAIGMENWGLNIYRGAVLYYSKKLNTEAERYGRVNVIAHELAHQWFGNLVTCKWWTDFWLNEGLTTYIESFGTRSLVPEFETEKTSLTSDVQDAMRFDIRENSHPIQLSSSARTKGSDFVYTLLYKKSSAIIRMMEGFLGEKTLHKGLKKFIKKFSYQSVEHEDLFNVLNEQAHFDQALIPDVTLQEIMKSWISHRGYPLVRVKVSGQDGVYISQERFYRKNSSAALEKSRWYIPVAVSTQTNTNLKDSLPTFWIGTETIMTHWQHNTSEWILLNSGATGYYRVMYDENLTKLIQAQLLANHALIHFGSRSQLIDDYFTFAFEGYSDISLALDFTQYLGQELELSVWTPVILHLLKLAYLLPQEDLLLLQEYMTPILDRVFQDINYEQSPDEIGNIVLFRVKLMDFACELGHSGCKNYSVTLWNDWRDDPSENRIPLDLRSVVYCNALEAHPTLENVGFVLKRQSDTVLASEEKVKLLKAFLACLDYDNPVLWLKLIETSFNSSSSDLTKDPEQVAVATYMLQQIAKNPRGRNVVMSYMDDNLEFIISFTGNAEIISGVITNMQDYCNTDDDLDRIKMFVENNSEKLSPVIKSIKASVAYMERNVKWISENKDKVHEWLMAHQSSSENLD